MSTKDKDNISEIYDTMLQEMVSGDALGAVIGHGGDVGNTDWYAPGDARVPKILGSVQTRNGKLKKGKKKKKSKSPISNI